MGEEVDGGWIVLVLVGVGPVCSCIVELDSFVAVGNNRAMAWATQSSATGGGLSRKMYRSTWLCVCFLVGATVCALRYERSSRSVLGYAESS